MKRNIDIVTNIDSIERTPSGAITGKLAFRVGSVFFPEADWNDFVVVILTMWWNALQELDTRVKTSVDLHFMDGPFFCRASLDNEGKVNLKFIDARSGEKLLQKVEIGYKTIENALLRASKDVLAAVKSRNWISADIDRLEALIRHLE
jgi:hypothetical protein